jgi:hypothetical protein
VPDVEVDEKDVNENEQTIEEEKEVKIPENTFEVQAPAGNIHGIEANSSVKHFR